MKRTIHGLSSIVLMLLLATSCLFAQEEVINELPPNPDSLHLPVWPGCYDPKMSANEIFRCTRECMAIQIYANIQWPVEKLANPGFVKINLHVNEHGNFIKHEVSSGLDSLIDRAVLQAFSLLPKSNWKAGYINNQSMATEFEAWIKYNPDAPEDNLLLLKNVKESKYQQSAVDCIYVIEYMPSFPGGQSALLRFMAENLIWPESCKESTVGGMMVVQFTVEPDGSISNSKVVKSLHPDFDQVGLNLVNRMPNWIPGRRRGMPTRTQMNLPIRIKLE